MRNFLLGFLLLIFIEPGLCQQKISMTIDDAIRIGLESSKMLHTSEYKVQAADARASEVNASRLPSLKFNGAYTKLSDLPPAAVTFMGQTIPISPTVVDNYGLKATVQQPLFTGGKISGAIDAADYSAQAAKEDLKKDKADVVYNIQSAYWNLFRAIEFNKFVDENVNQIKSHVTDAENLLAQGMLTTNDVMKIQVQLSDALVRQIDAKNNVKLAMYVLNNTLGLPLNTEIELASTIQISSRTWDSVDVLIKAAFEKRPEILGMNARVKAGEAGLTSAHGGWWPQIFLIGNYNYLRPNPRIFPTVDKFDKTWDVTVSLSFDIWNWWQTGFQSTQAQAQLAQAQQGYLMTKDGVMLDVMQNYLAVNQAKERKVVAEQGVKQAEENYRIMDDKYKQGLAPNSELLDAEVALLQARLNLTQSLVDYQLSTVRLVKAVGE